MKRILVASLAAGIGMFLWSAIAHMVLPLGETGFQDLSQKSTLPAAMQSELGANPGMYIFPGPGTGSNSDKMAQYAKLMAASPSGILIYHPAGATDNTGRQMTVEFLLECLEALLALALLWQSGIAGYAAGVGFVLVVGIVAASTTNISYWNWYGFPVNYTVAYMTTQLVGFLVGGLIGVAVLGKGVSARAASA